MLVATSAEMWYELRTWDEGDGRGESQSEGSHLFVWLFSREIREGIVIIELLLFRTSELTTILGK